MPSVASPPLRSKPWSAAPLAPWLLALLAIAVVLVVRDARALTAPLPGAVAFPSNVKLELPFPAGNEVRVLAGYSTSGGSSLHADTDATSKANDHYALDLTYANEPNFGKGLPITASLSGTVVRAGWATAGWANYGLRVILRHELSDGNVYHSLYAHLDSIAVAEGDKVAQGATIGTLGQSCQGALSCASFSAPHLHWALHRGSTIGGSGTGGSYGGNAVVPEPISGHEDLERNQVLLSTNVATPECGDGYCSEGESGASCAEDCCPEAPPQGSDPADDDPCFGGGEGGSGAAGATGSSASTGTGAGGAAPSGTGGGAGASDAAADLDEGCGCRVAGPRSARGGLGSAAVALALAALARRRRR